MTKVVVSGMHVEVPRDLLQRLGYFRSYFACFAGDDDVVELDRDPGIFLKVVAWLHGRRSAKDDAELANELDFFMADAAPDDDTPSGIAHPSWSEKEVKGPSSLMAIIATPCNDLGAEVTGCSLPEMSLFDAPSMPRRHTNFTMAWSRRRLQINQSLYLGWSDIATTWYLVVSGDTVENPYSAFDTISIYSEGKLVDAIDSMHLRAINAMNPDVATDQEICRSGHIPLAFWFCHSTQLALSTRGSSEMRVLVSSSSPIADARIDLLWRSGVLELNEVKIKTRESYETVATQHLRMADVALPYPLPPSPVEVPLPSHGCVYQLVIAFDDDGFATDVLDHVVLCFNETKVDEATGYMARVLDKHRTGLRVPEHLPGLYTMSFNVAPRPELQPSGLMNLTRVDRASLRLYIRPGVVPPRRVRVWARSHNVLYRHQYGGFTFKYTPDGTPVTLPNTQ